MKVYTYKGLNIEACVKHPNNVEKFFGLQKHLRVRIKFKERFTMPSGSSVITKFSQVKKHIIQIFYCYYI